MQDVSNIENYTEIISGAYSCQWALEIGEAGRLIDQEGDYITFGAWHGDASDPIKILVTSGGGDSGFQENVLKKVTINQHLFKNVPSVGGCISAEIDVEMLMPSMKIPRMAMLKPFVRVFNDTLTSGWLPQGTFYVDTREVRRNIFGEDILVLHGYDTMLKTERPYVNQLTAGATDIQIVRDIAAQLEVDIDARTEQIMTQGYVLGVEQIGQYSMREVLGWLAGAYAGCFIMSEKNKLRLVQLTTVPQNTSFLSAYEEEGLCHLVFGSDEESQTFTGDGFNTEFFTNYPIVSVSSVKVDGVETECIIGPSKIIFEDAPENGAVISVDYWARYDSSVRIVV